MENPKSALSPLPPGCQFFPSEQQLICHYLTLKNNGDHIDPASSNLINELDLYRFEPFDLPESARFLFGREGKRKHWYCFAAMPRVKRGPGEKRPAGGGFWKRSGSVKDIVGAGVQGVVVGTRKTFVFYLGDSVKTGLRKLICHYLTLKNNGDHIDPASSNLINELDLYRFEPFDLPESARFLFGREGKRKHWYCFAAMPRVKRGPGEKRPAGGGFWKRSGSVKDIVGAGVQGVVVGTRKTFVFYLGDSVKTGLRKLICHYLTLKNNGDHIDPASSNLINELDLYRFEPFDLPESARFLFGREGKRKHWYCFAAMPRVKQGPGEKRPAGGGFWKRSGSVKDIVGAGVQGVVVGTRKTFVFYLGDSVKTGLRIKWIMHEYALADQKMVIF